MTSQQIQVPVILKSGCIEASILNSLGVVTITDKGLVVDFISRVNYFGDDETFIHTFWVRVASEKLELTHDDVICFDWDKVKKVKSYIP